jgi:uncharacterized BrkB/YihY/UPF0761 family membrane protein
MTADPGAAEPARPGRLARWQRRAGALWDRVLEVRPETPLVDAGFEVAERDLRRGGPLLAGALAFRLFLVLVPLTLILVAGLGFLSADGTAETGRVLDLSDAVVATMEQAGAAAQRGRWVTLVVGVVALVLAVRSLVRALHLTHLLAWGLEPSPIRNQLRALLVGLAGVAATFAFGVVAQWVRARTPGAGIIASGLLGLAVAGMWLAVEVGLPRAEGARWSDLLPGAVLVGVASQALHAVTVFYFVGRVQRMNETYGPLGVAVVLLLWLYILGRAAVGSAMLNATLYDRRSRGLRNYAPIDRGLFRLGTDQGER